jgi:hypothetical protein
LINPSVASQGEMWTMLMQMIPSAYAIGQTECDASKAMGARTFVTRLAFTEWSDGLAKLALELRQETYRPDPIDAC